MRHLATFATLIGIGGLAACTPSRAPETPKNESSGEVGSGSGTSTTNGTTFDGELDRICRLHEAIHARTEIPCTRHEDCEICLGEVVDAKAARARGEACHMQGVEFTLTAAACCNDVCVGN